MSLASDNTKNTTFGIGREHQHPTPDLLKVPVIEVSSSHNIEEIELGIDKTLANQHAYIILH